MLAVEKALDLGLKDNDDVVMVRQAVRSAAVAIGFNIVEQTKIVTAASELARNTIVHGGGGFARIETVRNSTDIGLRLVFKDHGPGISNIEQAMQDGYTTGNGLGLGLGGARRLSSDFEIASRPGEGTRVTIVRWKG